MIKLAMLSPNIKREFVFRHDAEDYIITDQPNAMMHLIGLTSALYNKIIIDLEVKNSDEVIQYLSENAILIKNKEVILCSWNKVKNEEAKKEIISKDLSIEKNVNSIFFGSKSFQKKIKGNENGN